MAVKEKGEKIILKEIRIAINKYLEKEFYSKLKKDLKVFLELNDEQLELFDEWIDAECPYEVFIRRMFDLEMDDVYIDDKNYYLIQIR